MRLRLNERLNIVYDALSGVPDGADAEHDARLPLRELYVRGYVACHFHLRVHFVRQSHSHDFCIDFQIFAPEHMRRVLVGPLEIGGAGGLYNVIELHDSSSQQQRVKNLMLVPVGKFPESFEGAARVVRSLIGLRVLDDCPLTRWDIAGMYPLIRELLAGVLNRELERLRFSVALRNSDVGAIELPVEVVKGASEVVDNITQKDAHAQPPVFLDCCDAKDMIARLSFQLGAELDKIGFASRDGGVDYGLQAITMLTRPLNLGAALGKVDSHDC
jgi:hypothetical protein